ncbi:diacylglycerol kinase [Litorivicinus lipolyticus]|uniref:Diacylglycerol kinase n=1 Tax=Litorivicinus lipolyticus TaxID=418701 RepID=A0A5Q2QBI8_9GAMM|nr:diacylglycerol kinase [Litorivicinus lipolyticus]QGG80653.1 diacylglycerol kinase [Litorivicinus lipolyticus]
MKPTSPVPIPSGARRWTFAFKNSLKGLRYAVKHQAAVREELIALAASVPLALWLIDSIAARLAAVLSVVFVLIVEIINSAIETTLDRVSTEFNQLTGAAKDMGSLAVLLAMAVSAAIWTYGIALT